MLVVSNFAASSGTPLCACGLCSGNDVSVATQAKLSECRCWWLTCACSETVVGFALCFQGAMCHGESAIKFLFLIQRLERSPFALLGNNVLPINCMKT